MFYVIINENSIFGLSFEVFETSPMLNGKICLIYILHIWLLSVLSSDWYVVSVMQEMGWQIEWWYVRTKSAIVLRKMDDGKIHIIKWTVQGASQIKLWPCVMLLELKVWTFRITFSVMDQPFWITVSPLTLSQSLMNTSILAGTNIQVTGCYSVSTKNWTE